MKWINTTERLPELNHVILVEYNEHLSGKLEWMPYKGQEDWFKRNIRRWIDDKQDFVICNDVTELTKIMREADILFESTGGTTRHYMRDVFIPLLNKKGYHLCKWATESIQNHKI